MGRRETSTIRAKKELAPQLPVGRSVKRTVETLSEPSLSELRAQQTRVIATESWRLLLTCCFRRALLASHVAIPTLRRLFNSPLQFAGAAVYQRARKTVPPETSAPRRMVVSLRQEGVPLALLQ